MAKKPEISNRAQQHKKQALQLHPEVVTIFQQGFTSHRSGQLAHAKAAYEQVLKKQPKHFDALHLLGVIAVQTKNPALADELIGKAIEINPNAESAHFNRGNALKQLKRLDDALASFDKAIAIRPDFVEAFNNRGNTLNELKRLDDALASFDKAIAFRSDYADAFHNRGNTLKQLKRLDDALASYDKAIALKADYAEVFYDRGNALNELKRLDDALASYEKAIALKPDYAEAFNNRGNVLNELKRLDDALASFDKAIAFRSDYAEAFNNRGNTLNELKRLNDALASFDKAIAFRSDYAEAYYNRGIALQEIKQFEDAIASYDKAIALKPDYVAAYHNRGLLKLVLRDFYNGYLDYKYRWDLKKLSSTPQKTKIPSASKSGIKGRLLIWAEQGIGDEIFHAGLLPMLSSKDVSIALSADKRLHPIYRRSFPNIELLDKNILMNSSVDTGFDAQTPIGDLGFLLDINAATIKETRSPYLQIDPVKLDSYRRTTSALGSGLVCGVAWKSGNTKLGTAKSIGLGSLAPLLRLTGVHFVNLQYGDVQEEIQHVKATLSVDVHQVPGVDVFNDLESLLALIDACDVIVTTSNVTAHLAGSIGKRAAVLVPHSKGKIWYWHENDEYSFWYPSLKLFYQDNPLTWDQTIEDCSDWVKSLL
jgi:tetratricopeptide (TPR) repeat protein